MQDGIGARDAVKLYKEWAIPYVIALEPRRGITSYSRKRLRRPKGWLGGRNVEVYIPLGIYLIPLKG